MRILRKLAFYLGLALGLTTIAAAGTVALTYLLTGRLVSIEMSGEKPEVTLMTPDEVVAFIRERVGKAQGEEQPEGAEQSGIPGGESDA